MKNGLVKAGILLVWLALAFSLTQYGRLKACDIPEPPVKEELSRVYEKPFDEVLAFPRPNAALLEHTSQYFYYQLAQSPEPEILVKKLEVSEKILEKKPQELNDLRFVASLILQGEKAWAFFSKQRQEAFTLRPGDQCLGYECLKEDAQAVYFSKAGASYYVPKK